jgi:hypothetical protein
MTTVLRRLLAASIIVFASLAVRGDSARINISIPLASPDGLFHGRIPQGNAPPLIGPCPVTSGGMTIPVTVSRSSAISPALIFFDTTGQAVGSATAGASSTVIAVNHTAFQDIAYSWNFGDGGTSGTGFWQFGSNPGGNSMNAAIGAVAAHVYAVTPGGGDKTFQATVTATDGTNTASCTVAVTAFDPVGANGFSSTTCFFNSTIGTGCPAGATQTASTTISTPTSGQQFLYKCGDSFSGGATIPVATTKYAMGAYGSCVGTFITMTNHSSFPQFTNSGGGNIITLGTTNVSTVGPTDGRISNIDFEGTSGGVAVSTGPIFRVQQLLIYNSYANGGTMGRAWYCSGCTQSGVVASITNGGSGNIETNYWNYGNNTCLGNFGETGYLCGASTPSLTLYSNTDYNAFIGDLLDNTGVGTSNTWENLRVSSCRLCIFSNTQFSRTSPNNGGANFKLHSGNSGDSSPEWLGKFTELIEIDDNLFTGNTNGQLIEIAPQNGQYDERLQNIVFERNILAPTGSETPLATSGINFTIRDNAFYGGLSGEGLWLGAERRGTEWSSCTAASCSGGTVSAAPTNPNEPELYEVYNNTCNLGGGNCITGKIGWFADAASPSTDVLLNNSFIQNNLFFSVTGTSQLGATGVGVISNNSANTSQPNPAFTNASGTFLKMSDWKPTANFTGGTPVPNFFDALGTIWSPTWDLGAIHH